MTDIHELLDDVKEKSKSLVEEIEAFKDARKLNQSATESLLSLNKALHETLNAIKPYTEDQVVKVVRLFAAATAFNGLLLIIILILLLSRS